MRRRPLQRRHVAGGFTLVEALVAVLVASAVMVGILELHAGSARLRRGEDRRIEMVQSGRVAVDLIVRDARRAGSGAGRRPAFSEGVPLVTCEAQTLRIQADLPFDANDDGDQVDVLDGNDDGDTADDDENENGDGLLNDRDEDVEYVLEGEQLLRLERDAADAEEPTRVSVVADAVQSLEFTYLLRDGSEAETPVETAAERGRIVGLRVALVVRAVDPDAGLSQAAGEPVHRSQRFVTEARLRNR